MPPPWVERRVLGPLPAGCPQRSQSELELVDDFCEAEESEEDEESELEDVVSLLDVFDPPDPLDLLSVL